MFVQFTDETETIVSSFFRAAQDPDIWSGVVEVEDDDPRLLAFMSPTSVTIVDPKEKLKVFLLENPDVVEILK